MLVRGLTILLLCQLAGEMIERVAGLPVPGPVLGMAILFTGLLLRGGLPDAVADTADGLLRHLALLFVPAGVGVMTHIPLLAREWLPVGVALVVSTVVTIAVTGWVMRLMLREGDG